MTLLYLDDCFLQHDTGAHPENAARLRAVAARLARDGLTSRCRQPNWEPVQPEHLSQVHPADYVDSVRRFAARGGGRIEIDTVLSPMSFDIALRAAGAACDAVARVISGEDDRAVCLVRPPGHHALQQSAMGFCLFNNVAIAARMATTHLSLDRVLVVDWDVHHGNGTQDCFWDDERVGFFSAHRWPFYPGTGRDDETGGGPGLGFTHNLPIAFGTPRSEYLRAFRSGLEDFAARVKPQLVVVSAGFDAHRLDPVGSLGLEVEDFAELTESLIAVADQYAGGKLVSVLEGGYNADILAQCVATHVENLLK